MKDQAHCHLLLENGSHGDGRPGGEGPSSSTPSPDN